MTKEQINEIVEAAIQAPSWKNSQTARYYCILDADKNRDFAQKCLLHGNDKKVDGAALVVTTFVSDCAGFDREGDRDHCRCNCGRIWGRVSEQTKA